MRVLVCGSRRIKRCMELLKRMSALPLNSIIIEGGAPGIDMAARLYAQDLGLVIEEYKPNWKVHGSGAGLVRNTRMLKEGKPELVIAVPGGDSRGTWDMVRKAQVAGVPVEIIRYRGEGL